MPTWTKGVVGVVGFFALLQLLHRSQDVSAAYLPSPTTVVTRLVTLFGDGEFLGELRLTLLAWALALGIGVAAGVVIGVVLGTVPVLNDLSRIVIEMVRSVPAVALIPLAILLLGATTGMKVALAALACLWPVLFNTIYGVRDVDPLAKETARAFGFGRLATLVKVAIPSAGPFIFTGVRIAAAIGLVVVVATEFFVVGSGGVGAWMILAESGGSGARDVLAATVFVGLLGVAVNGALMAVESRVFRWHESQRPGEA